MKKQLILLSDMEGASGIFERNGEARRHGSSLWHSEGRACLTSDVRAVCEAANACGIDEILLYDGHFAGNPAFNIELGALPGNVRVFDTPERRFFWRRIRGQAAQQPFGLVTVGQHARAGEPCAYFPHTIQTPPIESLWVNGRHIAEIGTGAYNFCGTRYLANVGCAASMKEAREICPSVSCIPVKDKSRSWEPSPAETFPLITAGIRAAIAEADCKEIIDLSGPYRFELVLCEGVFFQIPTDFPWKGSFSAQRAEWQAPSLAMGLELFNDVRSCIK